MQVVVRGTDADAPQRVHHIDLARGDSEVLIDSREGPYADVRFGEVRPWQFINADGVTIDGRYYLPPDFDPEQTYPLIVYYYGGTSPVDRQFTGRYPFNLWAARGYVIYVLQPRGNGRLRAGILGPACQRLGQVHQRMTLSKGLTSFSPPMISLIRNGSVISVPAMAAS